MTLGVYRSTLKDADEIELELYTNEENKIKFKKSDGSLTCMPNGTCYVYIYSTLLDAGIIYCRFRTIKDGVISEWHKRHIAFRQ